MLTGRGGGFNLSAPRDRIAEIGNRKKRIAKDVAITLLRNAAGFDISLPAIPRRLASRAPRSPRALAMCLRSVGHAGPFPGEDNHAPRAICCVLCLRRFVGWRGPLRGRREPPDVSG